VHKRIRSLSGCGSAHMATPEEFADVMYFKHSRFLKFNHSLCTAANRQAPEMQQIHGGLHITQLCMPQPLHEASSRHTYCSFHRYCLAIADDRSSRPLIQLIQPLIQTSSMLYLLIRRVKTPPRVSIPRDSGVTSSSSRSVTSPFMTPPWMAAPEATTSSGFTPREGSFLNRSFTMLLTCVYTDRVRTMDCKQIRSKQCCPLSAGSIACCVQAPATNSKPSWCAERAICKRFQPSKQ